MKICITTPLYEPWSQGGIEKYVKILATSISKNNEVLVLTTQGPNPRPHDSKYSNPRVIELKRNNVASYYSITNQDPRISLVRKSLWYLLDTWSPYTLIQVKKVFQEEKPDIVHTNGILGFSSALFSVIKKLEIPHVHTLHTFELISRWSSLYRRGKKIQNFNMFDRLYTHLMRKASWHIDAVISPSQFLMDQHIQLGFFKNSKKHVIEHGLNLKNNIKPKNGLGINFLFLGRIEKIKGIHLAIDSFKKIKIQNIRLHIVGDGSYLTTLKNLAQNDNRIIFYGRISDEQLDELFNKCSYSIVPSIWGEPFGLVIIESLNNGLPVIGSNKGAIPELIKNGQNGFLFDPSKPESLKEIIEQLSCDSEILSTLSKNAIDSAKNYSIEKQIQKTTEVYDSLFK